MKIAVGVLAHNQVELLNALLKQLDDERVDVFLHLDKKSKISLVDIRKNKNLNVVKNRIDVQWGGDTQIKAELSIFNSIKNKNIKYDKVILVSGQDLLISPLDNILDDIAENPKGQFMEIIAIRDKKTLALKEERVRIRYHKFIITRNRYLSKLRSIYIRFYPNIFKKSFQKEIYFGAQWVNITYDAMCYIIDEIEKNNSEYKKLFYNGFLVDELFVQTILKHSRFSINIVDDHKRYIDWESGPEYPRTLRVEDYKKIKSSSAWFARKFDWNKDKEIIEKIID